MTVPIMGGYPAPPIARMTEKSFYQRFRAYILLAWNIPPVFGLGFLLFIHIFTPHQLLQILITPLEPVFIFGSMFFALLYFRWFINPVREYLAAPDEMRASCALARMRSFALHYWSVFLGYLVLAPASVVASAVLYSDFKLNAVEWFRINLVALIVSILVGLPIFFVILDLFGRALNGAVIGKPHLTIKTKVFLIGALVPLLIDTMLVQYFWTSTGYFDFETVVIWAVLELLAIGGSLIFVRSFDQSLRPLKSVIQQGVPTEILHFAVPSANSTDELGVLADDFRAMIVKLHESDQSLRAIAENAYDGILVCTDEDVVFANRRSAVILGYALSELTTKRISELVHPADKPVCEAIQCGRPDDERQRGQYEIRMLRKDGSDLPVEVTSAATIWKGRAATVVIVRDIADRKQVEEALYREKELAQVTLASIGDGVITTDTESRVTFLNAVAEYMTGWTLPQAQGHPLMDVFNIINELTRRPVIDPVARCLREGRIVGLANHTTLLRADGREFAIEDSAAPIKNQDGVVIGVVLVFHDVTRAREMANRLSWQATHDTLSGLFNRMAFEDRLRQLLQTPGEPGRETHVLLYIDLDQFKVINDIAGHVAGDEILRQIGALMQQQVRESDMLARLGGDEFGVILMHCDLEHARRVADNIHKALEMLKFSWDNRGFRVGASIGVLEFRPGLQSLTDLLSAADLACYAAKNAGRRRTHVYVAEDVRTQRHRSEMDWAARITEAVEQDKLVLFGQPILAFNGRQGEKGLHFEVLVRLQDEGGDHILPDVFLPAGERFDLMPVVDRWVVTRTFSLVADSIGRHGPEFISQCAVNLSGASLGDESFLPFIKNQIALHGVPGNLFCFEITETAAISNFPAALHLIRELRTLGCRFALDDFGSGMSSFSYLRNLPVDYLKIDGIFVRGIVDDPVSRTLVGNINDIGHLLGKATIAEYAEDAGTVELLRQLGVDYAQGYAIAYPIPLDQLLSEHLLD